MIGIADRPMNQRLQAHVRLRQVPAQQRAAWLDIAEEEFWAFGLERASLSRILGRVDKFD